MPRLAEAYEQLRRLPFPDHPDCDALDEWMLELAEVDANLAGLAESALGGGHIVKKMVPQLSVLSRSLAQIGVSNSQDARIYAECKRYLESLERVQSALLSDR